MAVLRTLLNPDAVPQAKAKATSPNRLYELSYVLHAPKAGLRSLTFPIAIRRAEQRKGAHDAGDFYAMQFGVNGADGTSVGCGYIGLQPREDGKALVVFSGSGPRFSALEGRPEADGGCGASNSTLIDFQFGHTYELTVERDAYDPSVLRAYAQNVSNPARPGPREHVKDLRVDRDVTLAARQEGFIEHYGKAISRSAEIGRTEGIFHAPFGRSMQGRHVGGALTQGQLSGRFGTSTTGRRVTAVEGGQVKAVRVTLWGVR
ncbi:MAG TPA: hypothetical protein VME63_07880 [Dyella sp.]|uniref:hypothetical protein n=1 Tax=Dyella sp. TaxID=1869338 RepID=UPI002B899114|nr:hypothetical protein [Dyella sp.]HTV85309.1 hypothetical protein [Dyella sp.]